MRALPNCGAALYTAGSAVIFGEAPASRMLAFVHPDARDRLTKSELSTLCAKVATVLVGTMLADMKLAWEQLKTTYPRLDCSNINSFMQQALLTASPELDEVENYLCEVGKGVVGRALANRSLRGPVPGDAPMAPLCGYHVAQRSVAASQYRFGGAVGPMVKIYNINNKPIGMAPWTPQQSLSALS